MADSVNKSFFDALLDAKAAKWSAGVAFDRSNPLPLDQWSVFKDKAAAEAYLTNAKAYPGQVIAYAEADVKEGETLVKAGGMVACVLSSNAAGTGLELKQIGVIPTGAGAINVTEDGEISVNVDNSTIKIVDGKLVAEIPEFEDTDTTYSVKDGEKVLKLEGTEFSTVLKLDYSDTKIKLLGKDDELVSEIDASAFVADGVLEDVSYNPETKDITFTWNIVGEDGKKKTDVINIKDLVDVDTDTTYTIGAGTTDKKVKVTLTPDEGEAQEAEVDAYNTSTMDDMLYNGKYTKVTKNADGSTTSEEVVSNITANKEKARLISTEEIAKLSALVLSEDGSVGVSGTISAENVTGLSDAITSQVTGANALNIAQGAQVNVIEEIKVNGTKVNPVEKSVNIAVPTKTSDITNDRGYITNVRVPEETKDGEGNTTYKSMLAISHASASTAEQPVLIVDDSAIQATIKNLSDASTTYKTKQSAYSAEGSTVKTVTKVEQNANGEVTVTYDSIAFPAPVDISGKKDKQTAVANQITDAAHVLTSLTQNDNGDISYGVKKLTPADIGAQVAGEYATKAEVGTLDPGKTIVQMIAEAQAAATYDDTKVKEDIQKNATAIENITKEGGAIAVAVAAEAEIARAAEKELADDIAEINALLNTVNNEDQITSLKELAIWVEEHGGEASKMAESIKDNADAIQLINDAEKGILVQAKAHSDANLVTAKTYTDDEIAKIPGVDDKTIKLAENKAYVAEVSTDILVQGAQELVLCGGNASGFATV